MYKSLIAILLFVPAIAVAQTISIVSTQPRYVTVYQTVCETREVVIDNSGAGSLIGGVVGGVAGNQVGKGNGKAAATIIGAVVGSSVGRDMAKERIETKQFCWEEPRQEQRGEIVTFNYNGHIFTETFE